MEASAVQPSNEDLPQHQSGAQSKARSRLCTSFKQTSNPDTRFHTEGGYLEAPKQVFLHDPCIDALQPAAVKTGFWKTKGSSARAVLVVEGLELQSFSNHPAPFLVAGLVSFSACRTSLSLNFVVGWSYEFESCNLRRTCLICPGVNPSSTTKSPFWTTYFTTLGNFQ
eukprot:1149237-Pelagomonas_calceolata.AAC.3